MYKEKKINQSLSISILKSCVQSNLTTQNKGLLQPLCSTLRLQTNMMKNKKTKLNLKHVGQFHCNSFF